MTRPLPTVPPVIETGLPDLSTTEGSHALLPCSASGSPKPSITWEKDGQPVSGAEGKFTLQPSGELLVKNLEVSPPTVCVTKGVHIDNRSRKPPLSTPCLSCSVLTPVQHLTPGNWGKGCYNPRVQMKEPRLRMYPVFPRHTVAKRQNQDLTLDLRG